MRKGEDEPALAQDVATLRTLIDRFLDDGVHSTDPALVAASLVLRDKLAALQRNASDRGSTTLD
jgi:hypothetical protein